MASAIGAIGDDLFPAKLLAMIASAAEFDDAAVLAYRQDDVPVILYDRLNDQDRDVFYDSYLAGVYLASPFYQAFSSGMSSGIYRLRDLAPDRFYQSEYYRRYYQHIGARDLLSYLVHTPENRALLVSIGRQKTARVFSKSEIGKLTFIEPVVRALSLRHWQSPWRAVAGTQSLHQQFKARFEDFGRGILTQRERDVVSLLLMGHSSKSIAAELNITAQTARVHRKNIYQKMVVRSQGELFSLLIAELTSE